MSALPWPVVAALTIAIIVLSAFFAVAAAATWGLAESRGRSLAE